MPRGMTNKLAIECSRPSITKAEIGKKMATILLAKELDPVAIKIDIQTIQLPITARTNAVFHDREHFITAILAAAGASPNVPPKKKRYAWNIKEVLDIASITTFAETSATVIRHKKYA
jgi:hypothetical protein